MLADAFPYTKIDLLYYKHVKESLGPEAEEILDSILFTFSNRLQVVLAGQLSLAYTRGYAETMKWAGLPFEGPPSAYSVAWAEEHISKAKLVDGINAETKQQISRVISDGIKDKRGPAGIARDIKREFGWMARGAPSEIKGLTLSSRAEMIARTETANALGAGFIDSAKKLGVQGKSWVTAGDSKVSDECAANERQGPIPLTQAFISGAMTPPQHPNCRCSLVPEMII